MKKSLTDNRDMTFDELIRLFIYRPYDDELKYMVDSDERIHIKGDTWIVTLDHKTGSFSFQGELHKYYSIDTIESIRDCFGDIYSVFNLKYDLIRKDTWFTVSNDDSTPTEYELMVMEEKKRRIIEYRKNYYIKNREKLNKINKENYRKRKNIK